MPYYFNLPSITSLTIPQQAALNETGQIAVSGGPGTGKSVVALWRHISNYQQGKHSLLLTYTTTLKQYLKACCTDTNAANNVGTLYRNRPNRSWDEIIVDEAQDMDLAYYNSIRGYGPISYGADDSQILYPDHSITQHQLARIFPTNQRYALDRNFRCTQRIMLFAKRAFPNAHITDNTITALNDRIGSWPKLLVTNQPDFGITNNEQNNYIIQIINAFRAYTHNIAILVPWKKHVQEFEQILNNNGLGGQYSFYYEDKVHFPGGCGPLENIHLTTFKSAKGLEFDTVIIPNFHKYNTLFGMFHTDWKDFYVACTRAKSNLYLISNNSLPELNDVVEL